jgi:arginase family enzyme
VGKDKHVHISWDVDSTDPETEIPCTGTPVAGGLTCEQIKAFIQAVTKHNRIVSFDVTELNLDLGSSVDRKRSLFNTIDVLKSFVDC